MKAQNRSTHKFLLPALALTICSVGCIAQSGAPDDQSASTHEALSASVGANAPHEGAAQLALPEKLQQRTVIEENALHQVTPVKETVLVGDPSAPNQDDGDGTEPDPHPWQPHATTGSQQH